MDELELLKGGVSVDDRGSVRYCNGFDFSDVKRFYQVQNHRQGYIRAWHGHQREAKYVWVAKGSALVGVVPMDAPEGETDLVRKFVLSDQAPGVLQIPPGYFNGFMNLEEDTRIIFFSSNSISEASGDDIRKPYDCWNIWREDFR